MVICENGSIVVVFLGFFTFWILLFNVGIGDDVGTVAKKFLFFRYLKPVVIDFDEIGKRLYMGNMNNKG